MQKFVRKSIVTLVLTIIAFAVGVAQADNRVYPTTATNWPRVHGASGTKQNAVFGYKVGANAYNFLGQSVISAQRSGAFMALVPTTGVTTATTFTDGSTYNFDEYSGLVLANGNYAVFGEILFTTASTRASMFIRTSAGAAVGGYHNVGSAGTVSRFNKAIQLTGGTYDGKVVAVGYSAATGSAGAGDMLFVRLTPASTVTIDQTSYIGTTNEEEAYAVCQVGTDTVAIAGRQKVGTNNSFYVKLVKVSDGTVISSFTLSGAAGTGDNDCIRDMFVDGDGNLVLVGTSGTGTGRVGYLAKLNPATGALISGYEFTTSETDVELMDADVAANGHIVVTGRQGNDMYLAEIQDNGHAYVSDWAHSYDNASKTGEIGNFVKIESDSTILVAGVANDAGASTDASFWLLSAPALQSNAGPTAFDLLTPTDVDTVTILLPTLTWASSTDAILGYTISYELTWADNSGFTSPTVVSDLADTTYTFATPLTNSGVYYWKVKALDGNDNETECTQGTAGWSFTAYVAPPTAFNLTAPADADSVGLFPTLDWEAATGAGISYELTWADNSGFTSPTVVSNLDTNSYTFETALTNNQVYYWKVKAVDTLTSETNCTQAPDGWSFTAYVAGPSAFNLTSPSDGGSVSTTPTLDWEEATGAGVVYELTWADNALFTGATVVSDLDTNSYTFTGGLSNDHDYYWKVKAIDSLTSETNCTQAPDGWHFLTPITPPAPMNVRLNSTVASTPAYYDNANYAGFDSLAVDSYDALDVPQPPVLGNNYIQTFFFESGFTGFRQKLNSDYRLSVGKNFTTTSYLYKIRTLTDQTATVTYTFDVSTNNTETLPVVFWDGTDYQNLLGATDADNTYTYSATGTTGSPETKNFAILIGDKTAPAVTHITPAASGLTEISRSSSTTLEIAVDNTSPVRRTTIAFSPVQDSTSHVANDPRENFTDLNNMPVAPATPDDPTNGLVNPHLTYDWIPATDDPAIFVSPTDVFPHAQLRFITEDWAGNIDTSYVDFAIVPDDFNFTGDYAAGWHLISFPLTPDDPATPFLTHTGNDSGIAGSYGMFQYTLAGGYTVPSSVAIAKGYWLVLDDDNTAAANNSGLGRVGGTIPGATEDVDLALDLASQNLIGVAVRDDDLGGNHLQADDWVFSNDSWTNTYTWTEVTTTADKNGDGTIWIDPTSLVTYDNSAGDFTTTIADNAALVPGKGYLLTTSGTYSGTLEMRTQRTTAAVDIVHPRHRDDGNAIVKGHNNTINSVNEFTGDWFVPIHMAMGSLSNNLSGFGCRNGATVGWDNGIDVTAPPLPPSGNYVRAVIDGSTWNSPFGRYFVTDIRNPFAGTSRTGSWDFRVNASQEGQVSMTFDLSNLAQYDVPATFSIIATINGQTFDLAQSNTITFPYTSGIVIVHVVASLDGASVPAQNLLLPKDFSIVNAYPNPFNPETSIRIGLPNVSKLQVVIYNSLGKEVTRLADGTYPAGYHNFTFDGHSLSSGVYFIRAVSPGHQNQIKRVVLVK